DAFVLTGVAGALACARRRPLVAGALLSIAWLKPQVGLPAAFLVLLFATPAPARAWAAFIAGSVGVLAGSALFCGPASVVAWIGSLSGYSHQLSAQPDIASLSGLYTYSAPSS